VRAARAARAARLLGAYAAAIAVALVLAQLAAHGGTAPRRGTELAGKVVKVRDGDSMEIRRGGANVRVRVFGIDSPERGQPWSARAKSFTTGLVANQDVVVVVRDVDRYGRIVGIIKLKDGRDLAHELLRAGLAWYYRRYANDPALEKLEDEARAARRGLWSEPRPVPPWKFRSDRRPG
jgi:endonuclease YncB( thermonuclease family)